MKTILFISCLLLLLLLLALGSLGFATGINIKKGPLSQWIIGLERPRIEKRVYEDKYKDAEIVLEENLPYIILSGRPLPSSIYLRVTLKNSAGQQVPFPKGARVWLQAKQTRDGGQTFEDVPTESKWKMGYPKESSYEVTEDNTMSVTLWGADIVKRVGLGAEGIEYSFFIWVSIPAY